MKRLDVEVSSGVWRAIAAEGRRTGETTSEVVERLVCDGLGLSRRGLFQVSTSAALVEGVFGGTTTVADLLRHGDFGLGTYDGLDGELVMLGGRCHRVGAGGATEEAEPDWTVPFAVVTRFRADLEATVAGARTLAELHRAIDALRPSKNVFAGLRIDGRFGRLSLRAACPAAPGEGLVEATQHQSEFVADSIEGTLVGFWTPDHARSIGIPGYHLHFLSDDRTLGGHVLGLAADRLEVGLHIESDLHVAIPETDEFLAADLGSDPTEALDIAE